MKRRLVVKPKCVEFCDVVLVLQNDSIVNSKVDGQWCSEFCFTVLGPFTGEMSSDDFVPDVEGEVGKPSVEFHQVCSSGSAVG